LGIFQAFLFLVGVTRIAFPFLAVSHRGLSLNLVGTMVGSTIVQIHDELEDASKACGAGFLATFRRVLIPLMMPGFIAGWILLATIFLREFSTSVFLYSPGAEPIGPLLYNFYTDGYFGPMSSLAVIVSVISMLMILAARRIGNITSSVEGR